MALRTRILLLVLLAALLPAAAMVAFLLDQRDRQVADAQRNLAALARNAGRDLDARIQGTRQLLLGLSQSRALATSDRGQCSAYLAKVLRLYPQYTGLLTINPDGSLHCDSLSTGRNLALADRSYFRQALASETTAIEPVFGRLTGLGVVQVALASRDEKGVVQFVLLASLDLEQFAAELAAGHPYPGTSVMVLDGKGVLMNRTGHRRDAIADAPVEGSEFGSTALFAFARSARPTDTRELPAAGGVPHVWAVGEPLGAKNLKIAFGVPAPELGAIASRQLNAALAVIFAATLVAFGLAWALSALGIRVPLERIIAATSRFGAGDPAARIGAPYPRGEMGELMRGLDRMLATLQAEEAEILGLQAGLEHRVADRTAQLQALNDEMRAFSYSVSHDMRGPLRAIDGYCALLLAQPAPGLDEQARARLEKIRASGQRMGALVEGLQSLFHITSDERRHEFVDLTEIAGDIAASLKSDSPARAAVFAIAPGITAFGDPTLLRQVLENLLGNAWKYSARQDTARIEFGIAEGKGGEREYFVADNGAGFDMAYAGRLFRPFERLHGEGEFSGTGIGLATVRRIVHRHGGHVRAEGRVGQGARFTFTLAPEPKA